MVRAVREPAKFTGSTLDEYLYWFANEGPSLPMVPADGITWLDSTPRIVLHREGQFQTQLVVGKPTASFIAHAHPNIDAYELYVGGEFSLVIDGVESAPKESMLERVEGVSRWWGRAVRIKPGVVHSGTYGPKGGAFLSIQHWLNGVTPSFVHLDWAGEPLDDKHKKELGRE
jgi:hypothetical protein